MNFDNIDEFVNQNKVIIDSNQLRKQYIHKSKSIYKRADNAYEQIENLFYFIKYVNKQVGNKIKKKEKDIYKKYESEQNINILRKFREELSQVNRDIEETNNILQPIVEKSEEIKKVSSKIAINISCFEIIRQLITAIFVVGLLLVNFIFDDTKMKFELYMGINHNDILLVSFLIQLLIVERFIYRPIKNKYNWVLITYLKNKIMPKNEELCALIKEYNGFVSQYKHINQYMIEDK